MRNLLKRIKAVSIIFITAFFILSCNSVEIEPIENNDYNVNNNNTNNINNDNEVDESTNNEVEHNNTNNNSENEEIDNQTDDIETNENDTKDKNNEDVDNNSENKETNENNATDEEKNNEEGLKENEADNNSKWEEPLNNDFMKYFNEERFFLNLSTTRLYSKDNIKKIEWNNKYYLLFPSDVINNSDSENLDIIWNNNYYKTTEKELINNEAQFPAELSVRFIGMHKKISTDNPHIINSLFYGFLAETDFKDKLGIDKWKNPSFKYKDNLMNNLKEKEIISSVVFSGLKEFNETHFANYFVFTFYSKNKNSLVFIIMIFYFEKEIYYYMEQEGSVIDYYNNWISFVSTFNFK